METLEPDLTPNRSNPHEQVQGSPKKSESFPRNEAATFDRVSLMERLMDDEEMAREIIATFMEELPLMMTQLRSYVQAGETDQISRQAHSIKGSAVNLSADALASLAATMEESARSGNITQIRHLMAALDVNYQQLVIALRNELTAQESAE